MIPYLTVPVIIYSGEMGVPMRKRPLASSAESGGSSSARTLYHPSVSSTRAVSPASVEQQDILSMWSMEALENQRLNTVESLLSVRDMHGNLVRMRRRTMLIKGACPPAACPALLPGRAPCSGRRARPAPAPF